MGEAVEVNNVKFSLEVADLSALPFEEQVRLIASASIVVGMHGAGIASSSMHMAVGTKYCCGVVEILPEGAELERQKAQRGYAALARRMGHTYVRMDVQRVHTATDGSGTEVPVQQLVDAVQGVLGQVVGASLGGGASCFLPEVLAQPYL